jgi:hypothetical protein
MCCVQLFADYISQYVGQAAAVVLAGAYVCMYVVCWSGCCCGTGRCVCVCVVLVRLLLWYWQVRMCVCMYVCGVLVRLLLWYWQVRMCVWCVGQAAAVVLAGVYVCVVCWSGCCCGTGRCWCVCGVLVRLLLWYWQVLVCVWCVGQAAAVVLAGVYGASACASS